MWLEICIQEMRIVAHGKLMDPSCALSDQQYARSRSASLTAAGKILIQFCLLSWNHWSISLTMLDSFLLAARILCFYLTQNSH